MAETRKSNLVQVGILLMVLAVAAGPMSRLIPGPLSFGIALFLDLFRVGFFIGLACLIIGLLRQRKADPKPPQNPS